MGLKAENILERALDMGRLGRGKRRGVSVSDFFLAWFNVMKEGNLVPKMTL